MMYSFAHLDDTLVQHDVEPLSLHPYRRLATSFTDLGKAVVQTTDAPSFITLCRDTLMNILEAVLRNFPENIFWDFDFFVASMLHQMSVAELGADHFLYEFSKKTVLLMELFGSQSNIRFRYLHDFMYGFDWVKWVQKDPKRRHRVAPFSLTFLDYLLGRGQEILLLIDQRDHKYGRLQNDAYRNPFGFSREPDDEARLLAYLAERDFVPIVGWDGSAIPIWNKPFHQTRETISQELHL